MGNVGLNEVNCKKRILWLVGTTRAMLVYFSGCACMFYSFGVFLPSICKEFALSRAIVAGAYSLFLVLTGVVGPLAGISITKFGARKNIIFGNLASALGLVCLYWLSEAWQLYLLFGVPHRIGARIWPVYSNHNYS